MSANPTRVDWEAPATTDLGSPLQEGNRVLESIARQESLRALLAFSELHEQIRNRRAATGRASDRDLFETERFILDEVLQLICDRVQQITQADGIVAALAEGLKPEGSEMVCRASAGPLAIERGFRLIGDSEFLQDCLASGRILRCDDCETDARVELDFARQIGARSTVLVPLRGRRQHLGVMQAFSGTARAFTDHDIRCFDLFAELVLSSLKPEDQDRRINWLSDVAGEVLQANPADAESVFVGAAATEIPAAGDGASPVSTQAEVAVLAQSAVIPEALAELPEISVADEPFDIPFDLKESATPAEPYQPLPSLYQLSLPANSRPGLSLVMGLVAVAALFSAGAWWGMQLHGKAAVTEKKNVAANAVATKATISPQSVTAPPAPPADVLSIELGSDAAPLTTVA